MQFVTLQLCNERKGGISVQRQNTSPSCTLDINNHQKEIILTHLQVITKGTHPIACMLEFRID